MSAARLIILITPSYVVQNDVDSRVVYGIHVQLIPVSNNKLYGEAKNI